MKRLLLVAAIIVLFGCASPTQPPPSMQTTSPPAPAPSRPEIVHTLVLASPPGQGALELTREGRLQGGTATVVYNTRGAIVATNDVGQWRFAYTKTSLEGAATAPAEWVVGLRAISIALTNTSPGVLEVDWNQTVFVDPSGRTQRVIHRGVQLNQLTAPMVPSTIASGATLNDFIFPSGGISFNAPGRASTWNAPALFERLRPGSEFSIRLGIRSGETTAPRTFRFTAVAAPPAGAR